MRRSWSGRAVAALVFLLAVVGVLGSGTRTAFAHAALESSTPAANSVLETGPPEIVLDFDEAIEADLASILLFDGDGRAVEVGVPSAGADSTIVHVAVPGVGDGIYAVVWRVTSADGHVVDGAFSFQVGTAVSGDAKELIDLVRAGSRSDPAVRWWYGVARFLSLAGAIVLLGAGWWLVHGPRGLFQRPAARRTLVLAWAALLVGSLFAFALFGAEAVAGSLSDVGRTSVWGDLATTHTGRMLLVRIALAGVLGVLLALRRYAAEGWWRAASATAAVLTVYSFSASGHPSATEPTAWWISVDLVHLASITLWIGGLLVLAVAGSAALGEPDGERMVRRFSLVASVCVPLIVVTGVAQTLRLAGGLDDITATDWGRLLLTKVTVVAALLAVAGVSRWLLQHDGAASVRRTVIAEFVLGMVVVAMAAGMVALPPEPPVPTRPFAEQLSASGLIAIISLSPGSVGGNEVHITMTPPGGSITPVVSATARVSLPSAEIPFSPVTLVREGPNHYSGSVTFPRSGDWTFEVVVQITDGQEVLLTTTVPIP
jgi:copper transport protein